MCLYALIGPLALAAVSFAARPQNASSKPAAQVRYEQTRYAMGTQFTIVAYGASESQLEPAVTAAFDEVARLDRNWSNYIEQSELSYVNRRAAEEPVTVDRELFQMLETCLRYSRETEGAFDITVGPLMKAWKFFRGSGELPAPQEVRAALARVGWQKVRLNAQDRTVRFAVEGMELDLGGIGKGYAVDRAAEVLREAGLTSALVLASTSSIMAVGTPPGQEGWSISVRHPKDARRSVAEVLLKDSSLSTAGSYEKFFRVGDTVYSHIFDPRTGYPAQGVLSATVVAATGTETDALDTAFVVMGRAGTERYLRQHPGPRVLLCTESGCEWIRGND